MGFALNVIIFCVVLVVSIGFIALGVVCWYRVLRRQRVWINDRPIDPARSPLLAVLVLVVATLLMALGLDLLITLVAGA